MTHLDGLVLARSAFHHSANYRAAMLFGKGRLVVGDDEKLARLKAMTESFYPGRWDELRPISPEASVKIRTGDPVDDEEDMADEVWAGIAPFRLAFGEPEPDANPGRRPHRTTDAVQAHPPLMLHRRWSKD